MEFLFLFLPVTLKSILRARMHEWFNHCTWSVPPEPTPLPIWEHKKFAVGKQNLFLLSSAICLPQLNPKQLSSNWFKEDMSREAKTSTYMVGMMKEREWEPYLLSALTSLTPHFCFATMWPPAIISRECSCQQQQLLQKGWLPLISSSCD